MFDGAAVDVGVGDGPAGPEAVGVGVGALTVGGFCVGVETGSCDVGVTGTDDGVGTVSEGDMVGSGVARAAGGPGPGMSTGVVVGVSVGDASG